MIVIDDGPRHVVGVRDGRVRHGAGHRHDVVRLGVDVGNRPDRHRPGARGRVRGEAQHPVGAQREVVLGRRRHGGRRDRHREGHGRRRRHRRRHRGPRRYVLKTLGMAQMQRHDRLRLRRGRQGEGAGKCEQRRSGERPSGAEQRTPCDTRAREAGRPAGRRIRHMYKEWDCRPAGRPAVRRRWRSVGA